MAAEPHLHDVDDLCAEGTALYARTVREGRIPRQDAAPAPCLVDFGLLYQDPADPDWLSPVAPAVALPRLLAALDEGIALQRRRGTRLAETFGPLMALDASRATASDSTPPGTTRPGTMPSGDPAPGSSPIVVLEGLQRINAAIDGAIGESCDELLTVQPGGTRPPRQLAESLPKEQSLLSKGGRMRTLYQHTSRYQPAVLAHYEQLDGDVQVRTLNEVTERLVVLDRTVAFIPANQDRTMALEVRHPALISYLVVTFERLWRLASPLWPQTVPQPSPDGITTRQRAIAGLLVEGYTDEKIAARLGMNIRTVRVHIAKLAATLGSGSRAQLGFLIGQSGILQSEG